MGENAQNLTNHKVNSNSNTIIEISLVAAFVLIIIFSCLVLFGSF